MDSEYSYDEVFNALEQLIHLQAHYASLLNMYDGGKRIEFKDAKQWLDRLREQKK